MNRAVAALAACFALACGRADTCLEGVCPTPCAALIAVCEPRDAKPLYVGRVADAPLAYRLATSGAGDDDVLISNGVVSAVIGQLDHQLDLAPTGGNLIALGPAGSSDDVALIYQLAGILPDDAFAYRTLTIEREDSKVAVTVYGSLDLRPNVTVATRYELAGCDPGVRVRSELHNGSAETHAWFVADTWHNGKRRVLPFSPSVDQGYLAPELDLLELTALWVGHDYDGAAAPSADAPAYASLACDGGQLYGVHDTELSALGTAIELVRPGDTLVFERVLMTGAVGKGPAPAIDEAVAARARLRGESTVSVRGRVVSEGLGFGGDVRRASVVIYAGDRPLSAVVPASDGSFAATVPATSDELVAEVWSFGRPVARAAAPQGRAGDIAVPMPATLALSAMRDGAPGYATAVLHPADDATRTAVVGSFHGQQRACAPWLGPVAGGSPACNRVIIPPEGVELEVPAGRYTVYATAGPEHTLAARDIELVAGEPAQLAFALRSLPVAPPGWLAADLHVHGRASFDSGIPDRDRVMSCAAANVAVIAATDHDVIGDYSDVAFALDLEDQVKIFGGLEATQVIPWLDVPGADLPRVIGHFNFWPLVRDVAEPRAGAPSDERIEPGELFDRLAPLVGGDGMMMLNHPWDEPLFGRDLGYLRAINFDPRRPIGPTHTLLARPGQRRNIDWNIIEVINGASPRELIKARVLWHSLLAQGYIAPGAGNSDSHSLDDAQLGWARNWVDVGVSSPVGLTAARFNGALVAGRFAAGNGVMVHVELVDPSGVRRPASIGPHVARAGDRLAITVRAAPWIPVDEVRVVTSRGSRVIAAALPAPRDPFGTGEAVRFVGEIALVDVVDRDDFVIIEAGLAYPLSADLDDDGVPDTGDNNGDGVVDLLDVEDGEDTGPLVGPRDPSDPRDPRYLVTRVVPDAYPIGFANPILVDVGGAGWIPPGLP